MNGVRGIRGLAAIIALTTVLSGCASSSLPSRSSFGIRPDVPVGESSDVVKAACQEAHGARPTEEYRACLAFNTAVEWSVNLEEAYRSRATQNRWWLYVAGTVGLATVAASGGLAAAGAASLGTIALLSVSGGFSAGFFGFLDNTRLAEIYTVAADDIATARSDARKKVADTLGKKADGSGSSPAVAGVYYVEQGRLWVAVTAARNTLEADRTSAAGAALKRAQKETETLKVQLKDMEKAKGQPGKVTLEGKITKVDNRQATASDHVILKDGKEVVPMDLTVVNVNLKNVSDTDLQVTVGGVPVPVIGTGAESLDTPNTWLVRFVPPATKPKADLSYPPILLHKNETLATAASDSVKVVYEK